MASDQHILVKIQETATTFSEVLKLASKIFIRVPKSQPQYKWVEATYGLTSPSFDKKLYLTKKIWSTIHINESGFYLQMISGVLYVSLPGANSTL